MTNSEVELSPADGQSMLSNLLAEFLFDVGPLMAGTELPDSLARVDELVDATTANLQQIARLVETLRKAEKGQSKRPTQLENYVNELRLALEGWNRSGPLPQSIRQKVRELFQLFGAEPPFDCLAALYCLATTSEKLGDSLALFIDTLADSRSSLRAQELHARVVEDLREVIRCTEAVADSGADVRRIEGLMVRAPALLEALGGSDEFPQVRDEVEVRARELFRVLPRRDL